MPTVDPLSAVTYYGDNTGTEARIPTKTLGQNDFLKLLVAQMTTQDPLNPKADTDFAAQMAQFTSLEQTKLMEKNIAGLRDQQELLQASSLLGRTVQIQTGKTTSVTGVVSAVQVTEGTPTIVVNGRGYDLSDLLNITPTPAPTATP